MYHPSRGGVRGGRDQFNWDDVKVDKHRENYLGHSIRAPVGRWQKGKDLHWYARDKKSAEAIAKDEIKRVQEEEDEAMHEMLGLAPKKVVPRHNQLDDREVSELLKKGQDGETSAPSYAAGERVEGLGFAPAPPQTVHGQVALENVKSSKAVGVVYEKDSSALSIGESRQKLAGNAEEQAPGEDDEPILDGQTAVRVGDEHGSHTSTSESEGVSREERKEERRRARLEKKERKREEKRARKQARFDGKIKNKHKKAGPDRQSWYDKEEIEREATDGKVRSEWKSSKGVSGTTKESEIENASRSYGKAHSSHHRDGTETMGQGSRRKLSTQDISKYVGRELHHKNSTTGLSRHDSSEASEEREEPDRDQSSEERHERGRQVIRYRSAGEGGDKRISARHYGNERSREREARLRHDSSEERAGNRRLGRYRRDEVGRKRGRVRYDSSEESDDRRRIAKYDSREETRAKRGQARHEGSWESDDSGRLAKHDSRKESRARSGRLRHDSGKETGDSGRLVKYDSREESRAKTGRLRHDGGEESEDGERLVKYDSREGSRANRRRVRHDSIVESDDSRERTGHNDARMREAPQYKGNYEGRVQGLHGGDNENTRSNKQRQDRRRGGDGKQETKRSPP